MLDTLHACREFCRSVEGRPPLLPVGIVFHDLKASAKSDGCCSPFLLSSPLALEVRGAVGGDDALAPPSDDGRAAAFARRCERRWTMRRM